MCLGIPGEVIEFLPDQPDRCLGREETAVAGVDARLARVLLASLPAAQRRLLLLRVVAGLSAEDTGCVLDMPPGRGQGGPAPDPGPSPGAGRP